MIKISAKPISSPGRAEKYYPPPLMRFLRSNVGSKSRGRSRSSPMFVRKKNTAAIEAPEPSSPKVTCMGQVRVRRSSKNKRRVRSDSCNCCRCRCSCKWIHTVSLCCHGCRRPKRRMPSTPCCFRPHWRKWARVFSCSKRKTKIGKDKETEEEELEEEADHYGGELEEEEEEEEPPSPGKVFSYSSPPKNALVLIRSRSAPYRTSSLASRFWGSPVGSEETEQKQSTEQEDSTASMTSKPESEESSIKSGFCDDFQVSAGETVESIKERMEAESPRALEVEPTTAEEEEEEPKRPVLLTRCKSEPARIGGDKFEAEVSFWNWKKRRLGFT